MQNNFKNKQKSNYTLLLNKMKQIIKEYKIMGLFPFELYTLMSNFALKKNINYNMDFHLELMKNINY